MKNKNLNGFEKAKVRWEKYFKIMVKLEQNLIRSTTVSIAYSPCYRERSGVLMHGNEKIALRSVSE